MEEVDAELNRVLAVMPEDVIEKFGVAINSCDETVRGPDRRKDAA
jgi:hypothetical protein